MLDKFDSKDYRMRKAFAEKVKNIVGVIRQNLQNPGSVKNKYRSLDIRSNPYIERQFFSFATICLVCGD